MPYVWAAARIQLAEVMLGADGKLECDRNKYFDNAPIPQSGR